MKLRWLKGNWPEGKYRLQIGDYPGGSISLVWTDVPVEQICPNCGKPK